MIKQLYWLSSLMLLTGCAMNNFASPDDPNFAPVLPETPLKSGLENGSLFSSNSNFSLYDDRKAFRVGDILTVNLNETTKASKKATTNHKKETTENLDEGNTGQQTILSASPEFSLPHRLPITNNKNLNLQTNLHHNSEFKGDGSSDQNNMLTGSITVTVFQVLPNGNLNIRGEKWLSLNQGAEYIRLSGLVRPGDINPDNTISSTKVANVRIAYSGTGAVADSNAAGWLVRFFNNPLFPF